MRILSNADQDGQEQIMAYETNRDLDRLVEISRNNIMCLSQVTQKTIEHDRRFAEQDAKIADLAGTVGDCKGEVETYLNQTEITASQVVELKRRASRKLDVLIGLKRDRRGRLTPSSRKKSKVYRPLFYSRIYGDLNREFGVNTITRIRQKDFDKAVEIVDNWMPFDGLEELMREAEENWCDNNYGRSLSEYLSDDTNTPQIPFDELSSEAKEQ